MSDPLLNDAFADLIRAQNELIDRSTRATTKEVPLYAKGTWVPVLSGATTPGTFTYSVQVGAYTRIGNICHFHAQITISAAAVLPVGSLRVTGLPFVGVPTPGSTVSGGAIFTEWTFNLATAHTMVQGEIRTGTLINITKTGSNLGPLFVQGAEYLAFGGNFSLYMYGQYQVSL